MELYLGCAHDPHPKKAGTYFFKGSYEDQRKPFSHQ